MLPSTNSHYNLPEFPILLVEDNLDDVLITKRAMAKGRIRNKLYIVHDGEQALDFFQETGKIQRRSYADSCSVRSENAEA